jgi:YggT family protein
MIFLSTFLKTIIDILSMFINVYLFVIVIGALISWARPSQSSPLTQIIDRLTIPLYNKIGKYVKTSYNGIEFAPILVLFVLQLIDKFFLSFATQLASDLIK